MALAPTPKEMADDRQMLTRYSIPLKLDQMPAEGATIAETHEYLEASYFIQRKSASF
jgi:hypothetical protein